MTVLVAFLCSDGVVVAADSMITPSMGGINVGHHHGQKLSILQGHQVFAFAGDHGQSERVRIMANGSHQLLSNVQHPIDYPLAITQAILSQFQSTGIAGNINTNPMIAYPHGGNLHCCVFEGALQPRLLDSNHYYAAAGSGKLSADPFLRFLTDIFCRHGQPSVADATFLATWVVQHVIDVNPGGVAAPIRLATLETNAGLINARILDDVEIDEHIQAVDSARQSLRDWRDDLQSGDAAYDAPDVPTAPTR